MHLTLLSNTALSAAEREKLLALLDNTPRAVVTLDLGTGPKGIPPSAFRMFASGGNETTKGVFTFNELSARDVMDAAKDYGNQLPFDWNHAQMYPAWLFEDPARAQRAFGWFTLEVRDGALWAKDVQWTDEARGMLERREVKYFSPAIGHTDDGRITRVINCALTPTPASKRQEPLVLSARGTTPKEPPKMKTLLTALGLADTATEAEALQALTRQTAVLSQVQSILKVTGGPAETLAAVKNLSDTAAEVPTLKEKLAALTATEADRKFTVLFDEGLKALKVTEDERAFWKGLGAAELEKYLAITKPKATTAATAAKPGTEAAAALAAAANVASTTTTATKEQEAAALAQVVSQLSPEEKEIAKLTGLTLEQFAKGKLATGGKTRVTV